MTNTRAFQKLLQVNKPKIFHICFEYGWRLESPSAHYFPVIPSTSVSHHILIYLSFCVVSVSRLNSAEVKSESFLAAKFVNSSGGD